MCFEDEDYPWFAAEQTTTWRNDLRARCVECRQTIHLGERCCVHYFQENESGTLNSDGGLDLGETQTYYLCQGCNDLRELVSTVEVEAGCPSEYSRPPFAMLFEALEGNWLYSGTYVEAMHRLRPDLASHYTKYFEPSDDQCNSSWHAADGDAREFDYADIGGEG